jgi:hypothetical protein
MSRDIARQPQAQLQANVKPAFVPPLSAWRSEQHAVFLRGLLRVR